MDTPIEQPAEQPIEKPKNVPAVAMPPADAELIIETKDLVKKYGKLVAVNHLSLSVPRGSIYGFVGPNGAGKTSTMRILTTLMLPSSGQAFVAGYEGTKAPPAVPPGVGSLAGLFCV